MKQPRVKIRGVFYVLVSVLSILNFSVTSPLALAISQDDLEAINKGMYYYGGETLGQQLCGSIATDTYPIRTPEITDPQALANAIDDYIASRQPTSPYRGLGVYFVEGGMRAGINPIFLVAVAEKETSLGTNRAAQGLEGYNGFGRTANTATQPYVRPATRAWYAWESWEASLMSPQFPADGTRSQPDDMFQFIARRFEGNLSRGLDAFFEGRGGVGGYAPSSDGNNVPAYIELVVTVTNSIAERVGGAIDLTRINPGGGSCGETGDIVATALLYAWPDYRPAPYTTKKPEYDRAIRSAMSRGEFVGGLQHPGVDCGGYMTRAVRDSGVDPSYNRSEGNTDWQHRYLEESNLWRRVSVSSTADLQPGDIAIRSQWFSSQSGHTFMYVGNQPGFETHVASASVSFTQTGWRAPMAGRENVLDSSYSWYRFIGGDAGNDE